MDTGIVTERDLMFNDFAGRGGSFVKKLLLHFAQR